MGTEYPKRISIPSPDRVVDGVRVPQPPVTLTVKNADHEAQWLRAESQPAEPATEV